MNTPKHPTPAEVRTARGSLTQKQAAELIGKKWRTWQNWETGVNKMSPNDMEIFLSRAYKTP